MTDLELAEAFVLALNDFDVAAMEQLLGPELAFSVGPHQMDREEFVGGLASGPASDPYLRFEVERYDRDDDGVVVIGNQVYLWRESNEIASSQERAMRLEIDGGRIVGGSVQPPA